MSDNLSEEAFFKSYHIVVARRLSCDWFSNHAFFLVRIYTRQRNNHFRVWSWGFI